MGDMGDTFREMTKRKKDRHENWFEINTEAFKDSSLKWRWSSEINQTCILLREEGKPPIDFFPHTGRWKISTQRKMYRGGAQKFMYWYQNQNWRSKR